jgi:hypothetical protein
LRNKEVLLLELVMVVDFEEMERRTKFSAEAKTRFRVENARFWRELVTVIECLHEAEGLSGGYI